MAFSVSKISGAPSYDSLPVAKIITYPLEQRDYKPFAQNILCVSDSALHLRMWAFEVNPTPTSRLECVLYLFRDRPDTALAVMAVPVYDNTELLGTCLLGDGEQLPASPKVGQLHADMTLHPHNGEDLQGVYWGYTVDIPLALLEEWGGSLLLNVGNHFPGNFFKTCADTPYVHKGCYHPADFTANPYTRAGMGDFTVVGY